MTSCAPASFPFPVRAPVLAFLLHAAGMLAAHAWNGAPSPHDDQSLVIVRPEDFAGPDGMAAPMLPEKNALFGQQAIEVSQTVCARFEVLDGGEYTLWVRAGQAKGIQTPIEAELARAGVPVLSGRFNDGPGAAGRGGPAGLEAYSRQAMKVTPDGKTAEAGDGIAAGRDGDDAAGQIGEEEMLDALGEGARSKKNWVHMMRIEHPGDGRPFTWWKVGRVRLEAGRCELRLRPQEKAEGDRAPRVDAAFLTTFGALVYPYAGDLDAAPASFVRFRLARLPEAGVQIGASLRIHYEPWNTPRVWLNPSGTSLTKAEAHTETGFTRWYRLQDIEHAPGFGAGEAHLLLQVSGAGSASEEVEGATQFAVFPHRDQVLREISWNEPEGLQISMAMDFQNHLHLLRTFRDHARECYERALDATGGRLYPLTRGDLFFGNAWGRDAAGTFDMMVKTLRLLGFNCVDASTDPVGSRKLYGWSSHAGHYWPPSFMPFDEESARRQYDAHYEHFFDREREVYEGVTVYQIADEPAEIAQSEMSAPRWRHEASKDGGRWVDDPGNSDLNTRRVDYHDCVLEGKVQQQGTWFGFRAALDDGEKPKRYVYWHLGKVSWSQAINLAVGKVGIEPASAATLTRPGARVGGEPTPFKIIYEGGAAALYLNGVLVHQHDGLPRRGGFGFTGPPKAVCEIRFRRIGKQEHIVSQTSGAASLEDQTGGDEEGGRLDVGDLDMEEEETPGWARPKPLEAMVREDWVASGGMPEAHEGFRRWAAGQGLTPDLFGQKAWEDVHMLTVASLVQKPEEARLFYHSRRYSGHLTPRMFALAAEAIQKHAPNPSMLGFVALSGHSLYFPSQTPLDMFQLGSGSPAMMPGISDWMTYGGWRWDSHQAVAFSVAFFNAGARQRGRNPVSFPMMHCVWPSIFRAYTMLANQVRYISFYNYGPYYAVTEGFWSESPGCYVAAHLTNNRAAQVDDVLASARVRPSRVAMLYAMSNEYWNAQASFADKRASFLALSHEYYQPELVTEDQVLRGDLEDYDALYVLDPIVASAVQHRIGEWVRSGGCLWSCADALTRNEFNEPADLLQSLVGLQRDFKRDGAEMGPGVDDFSAVAGEAEFLPHAVAGNGRPRPLAAAEARIRARYGDGSPAWLEWPAGQGRVVYLGHRAGLTYSWKAVRLNGFPTAWADTGRAPLTVPLHERGVDRELVLSQPLVMAAPLSTDRGTVIILYNMQPSPRRALEIGLREPRKPQSVEAFDGLRLNPLPFDYRDGRAWMTLPELHEGQMVLVRRQPASRDDRLDAMQAATREQLSSADWRALSAGSWFAGFFPQWGLGEQVVPLLAHARWEVRRTAAESLGRMGHAAAAGPLRAALAQERDAHAMGDLMLALGQVGDEGDGGDALRLLKHADAFVRRQAVRAAAALADRFPGGRAPGLRAAEAALGDPDLRVRREGIQLLSRLDSDRTLEIALGPFGRQGRRPEEQPLWLDAVCGNEKAFTRWLGNAPAGGPDFLLEMAVRRSHPKLAAALADRAERGEWGQEGSFFIAALRQRDSALARKLLKKRQALPAYLSSVLPLILEATFEARLGHDLNAWEKWLEARQP
ncbi:MAG: hypothetical protein HYU36_21155 [Planctomycetes bacterium]|nr:hypothetical protein [Planctomycetota bacterium]